MSRWRLWVLVTASAVALLLLSGWMGSSTAFAEEPSPSPSSSDGIGPESSSSPSSGPLPSPEPSEGDSSSPEPSPSPTGEVVYVEPGPEMQSWLQGLGLAAVLVVALSAVGVVGSWGSR